MQFNTWGIGRRTEITSEYEADKFVFIETVRSHLDLCFIEIKGGGQPVQIALGDQLDQADTDAAQQRVTPFFSSFDALDYFCQLNLQHYLAIDKQAGLPVHWFWQETKATGRSESSRPWRQTADPMSNGTN